MKYRHNAYTISGQTITLTGVTNVTPADVRLIIDETAMKVICSSMKKSNISCSGNVITVPSSVATLDASHDYTIELDFGEKAPTGYALQGNVNTSTNTAIYAKLEEMDDYLLHGAAIVANSDNVGTGNQGYTIVLDQTQSVNGDTLNI